MNAYDVVSRGYWTEISKAQYTGCSVPGQNQLVPGMTRAKSCLANADLRKGKFHLGAGR